MLSSFVEAVERLQIILIVAAVVQTIWIIWFTTAIASMRRSLQDIRHNSNATAFKIERLDRGEFSTANDPKAFLKACGACGNSAVSAWEPRPVAYLRHHGGPTYLCLDCAEKEHRTALRPWDSEKEKAAVAELRAEAGISTK